MKVVKFGGSSVGTVERIKNVIEIIKKGILNDNYKVVVFSAYQGITDQLIKTSKLAEKGNQEYLNEYSKIEEKHITFAKELINLKNQSSTLTKIKLQLNELEEVLHGVYLIKELSPKILDYILSFGERLSAYTISEALKDNKVKNNFLDTRTLIKTDNNFGNAKVLFQNTKDNFIKYFDEHKEFQVATGFIGSTLNNETTTLGRGGSDYTASIFGALLNAEEIEIWSDVNGVLTSDPRKVKNAFPIKYLTYEEAMELSHFGAKVIYPPTMQPAMKRKIPIRIKNTFNPTFDGTLISNKKLNSQKYLIKGISSIDKIALIRVQGSGMVGVAGIAERIFTALAKRKINVILITQASSEHSICFAILPKNKIEAKESIEEEFRYEIYLNQINEIIIEENLAIIAVVGENMRKTPGIAAKVFQALGKNGINISAIAQGSSELNISTVISINDEAKALNALHDTFFLSQTKSINLFLVGPGLIGKTFLKQLKNQQEKLKVDYFTTIKVIGLINTKKMFMEHSRQSPLVSETSSRDEVYGQTMTESATAKRIDENGINLDKWEDFLTDKGEESNINSFIQEMKNLNLPNSIFIDSTASDEIVNHYVDVLNSNISIVTPNKKANTKDYKFYLQLKESAQKNNVKFYYETNVGAGLPIINTIKDLVSSGDRIYKIEGILSGTLSYIFNSFTNKKKFSDIIFEARKKGYTEPDPREDLNGNDVARKLLILARESGYKLELKDIKVENLILPKLRKTKDIKEFFNQLKDYDDYFEKIRQQEEKEGKVLRYIAKYESGKATVCLQSIANDHPFYHLQGSDNIIAIYTDNYNVRPLIIQGPGAGAEVTAAGVFADVLRIANYLS